MKTEEKASHVGRRIHRLDNILFRGIQLAMAARGVDQVTAMNGWVLGYLHDNQDRPVYQKDVETEFSIGRSAVTKLVVRMEEKGFIKRFSNPADARLKRLVLTERGEEQFCLIASTIDWVNEKYLEDISEEEQEQLMRILRKIRGNAEQVIGRIGGSDRNWINEIETNRNNRE